MSGNAAYSMKDAAIVSIAHEEAPEVVTSDHFDELLAELVAVVRLALLASLLGPRGDGEKGEQCNAAGDGNKSP